MVGRSSASLVLILLVAIFSSARPADTQAEVSTDEYRVYDAVLAKLYPDTKASAKDGAAEFVILSPTTVYLVNGSAEISDQVIKDWTDHFRELSGETIVDYLTQRTRTAVIKPSFKLRFDYAVRDASGPWLSEATRQKKEMANYEVVRFSRVGFDRRGSEALVYMSYYCGPLCGHGGYFLLARIETQWRVTRVNWVWES